jgi:hypothetical protein
MPDRLTLNCHIGAQTANAKGSPRIWHLGLQRSAAAEITRQFSSRSTRLVRLRKRVVENRRLPFGYDAGRLSQPAAGRVIDALLPFSVL